MTFTALKAQFDTHSNKHSVRFKQLKVKVFFEFVEQVQLNYKQWEIMPMTERAAKSSNKSYKD